MTIRSSSSSICYALTFALLASPVLSEAQTPAAAPADASTNAAPAPAPTPSPAASATATPADTNAPASATPEERPSTYTIAQGDSLWTIAHKFGTTVVKLRKLNKLKKGALLHPGQVLQIPPASTDTK